MKKKCAIMIMWCCMIATIALAQEQSTGSGRRLQPKIGIKAGVNFSNLYVDDVKDENVKIGPNVGLFAKLPLVKGFSIQPELLYSNKGSKITYDNLFGSGEYRFNLNYLELTLLGVINVGKYFNIHAGGYAAYLANVNIKDMQSNGNINNVKDLRAEDFHRFDCGLVGGLGVDIGNFTAGARYNYGLREVGKSGTLSGNLTKNSKNSVATLYVGVGF